MDKKPGSGKIWKNQRTIPREPRLRVLSQKGRGHNHRSSSMAELSKIISLHNLSIQNLDLNWDFDEPIHDIHSLNSKNCFEFSVFLLLMVDRYYHWKNILTIIYIKSFM